METTFTFSKIHKAILFIFVLSILGLNSAKSQTISTFENVVLPTDSFWNGADLSGGFTSGSGYFYNTFTDWGSFTSWAGFAISDKNDSLTAGYGNQYSAYSGKGYNYSNNYAVGYCYPTTKIKINNSGHPKIVNGFYVTNSTYAAISMRDGDAYAKKFGGTSGDDPDWFKLSIWGFKNGIKTDTIDFYLADFRFTNNTSDYIIKDWTWVELSNLGNIDSLEMALSSTDSSYGFMNTPAYYCMDNFTVDYLPEVTYALGNTHLDCFGNFYKSFNLDTIFTDFDDPISSFNYSIIYHSAGIQQLHAQVSINNNILDVSNLCLTKLLISYTDTIVVKAELNNLFAVDTLIINGDITDGIQKISIQKTKISPNPATDFIHLESNFTNSVETIEIEDLTGRKINNFNITNIGDININISQLCTGIYFLKLKNNSGCETIKFVKK